MRDCPFLISWIEHCRRSVARSTQRYGIAVWKYSIRSGTALQHRYGGVRGGACAAPGFPKESREKTRKSPLGSACTLQRVLNCLRGRTPKIFRSSIFCFSQGRRETGIRPTKSYTVSFVPLCFRRTFPADECQPRSPTGVKGRNALCAGVWGAQCPHSIPCQGFGGAVPPRFPVLAPRAHS